MKAPAALSKEAKKIWSDLQSEYGIHDPAGLQLLNMYGQAFDRVQECRKMITKEGLQVADRFGQYKAHPLTTVERDARAQMMQALKALNIDVEPLNDRPGRPAGR